MSSNRRIDFWIFGKGPGSIAWLKPEYGDSFSLLWLRYVTSFPLEELEDLVSAPNEFFDAVILSPKDYKGLSVEEAYRVGMEMGCFIQSVAIARNMDGPCAIRIPSDRAERAKAFLEESDIKYSMNWVNDDVMIVRLLEE